MIQTLDPSNNTVDQVPVQSFLQTKYQVLKFCGAFQQYFKAIHGLLNSVTAHYCSFYK